MTLDCQRARTEANKKAWLELQSQPYVQGAGDHVINSSNLTNKDTPFPDSGDISFSPMDEDHMATFSCLSQAIRWCSAGRDGSLPPPSPEVKLPPTKPPILEVSEASHVQVLITGSLHLVGAAMNILGCTVDEL